MKRLLFAMPVLIWMVALTSCSNSEQQKNASADSTATVQSVKTMDTVIIEGMQFKPAQLTVNKGDTIIWINNDIVAHNVTEDTAQTWTSDTINIGNSWKKVVDNSFNYLCTIHPTMKGSVTVVSK